MSEQAKDARDSKEKPSRAFRCPCGKDYLSYPALYTHVKTKHDGKAPGELIVPKTEKTRGRPRNIIVDTPIEDSQGQLNLGEEVRTILRGFQVQQRIQIQKSQGNATCQDMATAFMLQLQYMSESELSTVECYLDELRKFLNHKLGQFFWRDQSPGEIIDYVNEFYHNKQQLPFSKVILQELTLLLFKWMYKKGWTVHRLALRKQDNNQNSE